MSVSLPAPPNRLAFGERAVHLAQRDDIVRHSSPNAVMVAVFATVGVPPRILPAPPFSRIFPAASRLITIELLLPSPNTLSRLTPGMKTPLTGLSGVVGQESLLEMFDHCWLLRW